MSRATRSIITRLSRLGYNVLSFHHGTMYIAGLGMRDTEWAIRVIRRAEASLVGQAIAKAEGSQL